MFELFFYNSRILIMILSQNKKKLIRPIGLYHNDIAYHTAGTCNLKAYNPTMFYKGETHML